MTDFKDIDTLIASFLSGKHPAFNPEDINVLNAQKKVMKQIEEGNTLRRVMVFWQRIAAIIAIPLLLLSLYLIQERNTQPEEQTIYQELIAPYGTISHVTLPDGSSVWLNSGSSLKYPVRFQGAERNVSLDGEGYFDVQSDRKKPFIVQTSQMKLIATGTQFNIEAYGADSITAVTMVSGEINVSFNNLTPMNVRPNERAFFNNQENKVSLSKTDPYKWYAWKDGLMIFRDDPLSYVFKRLSQTFNVEICLRDTTVADDLYRATFGDESLDEILRLLEKTAPIKFVHHKRTQTKDNLFEKQIIDVYKQIK